ncbi:hypothetical protein OM076_44560, partial [Solirubrobacter ginsenosidimutans]
MSRKQRPLRGDSVVPRRLRSAATMGIALAAVSVLPSAATAADLAASPSTLSSVFASAKAGDSV